MRQREASRVLLLLAVGAGMWGGTGCSKSGVESDPAAAAAAATAAAAGGAPPARTSTGQNDIMAPKVRDDVTIKINSSRQVTTIPGALNGGNITPTPGKTFLICNVTLTHNGQGDMMAASPLCVLRASNKQIYMGAPVIVEPSPTYAPLNALLMAGGTATGDAVFEVDAGAQPVTIEYADMRE